MKSSEEQLNRKNKERRKKASLTTSEWLTFFFLPFFTTKSRYRNDHFSESELDRFKKYGFENKYKQAVWLKFYGYLFWVAIIVIVVGLLK